MKELHRFSLYEHFDGERLLYSNELGTKIITKEKAEEILEILREPYKDENEEEVK